MFRRNVTGFGSGIICIEYLLGLRAVTPVEAERTGARKAGYASASSCLRSNMRSDGAVHLLQGERNARDDQGEVD